MSVTNGPNLGVMVNAADGDAHGNQFRAFLRAMDGLVMPSVKSRSTTAQPGSPTDGDCYIIPSGATGAAWTGQTNKIARWSTVATAWEFFTPKKGWRINVQDEGVDCQYNSSLWLPDESSGYIDGLKMEWVSGTSLKVNTGAAYIPGAFGLVALGSAVTKSGLSLTASTWYHVYLYLNGTTPDIEIVTTAPAAPYFGTARAKTGDTTRRYVGSVLTDGSSNIRPFIHNGNAINYRGAGGDLRVLSAGAATSATAVPCSSAIPVTAIAAICKFQNNGSAGTNLNVADGSIGVSTTVYVIAIAGGSNIPMFGSCPVDSSQNLAYMYSNPGGVGYIDIHGYNFER